MSGAPPGEERSGPSRARVRAAFAVALGVLLLVAAELTLRLLGLVLTERTRADSAAAPGVHRILAIGDSYTFGVYVDRSLTWPAQLERELRRLTGEDWEVVNAGIPGQNTAMMRARLDEQIARYRPELVIALGGTNNAWNALETAGWGLPGLADRFDALLSGLKTYQLLKLVRLRGQILRQRAPEAQGNALHQIYDEAFLIRVTRDDFVAMAEIARRRGVRFLAHSYPHPDGAGYLPLFNRAIAAASEVSGTGFVDQAPFVRRVLDRYDPRESYFEDLHPKIAGYHLMALNLAMHIAGVAVDVDAAHREFLAAHEPELHAYVGTGSSRSLYNDFARASLVPAGERRPTASLRQIDAPTSEGGAAGRWSFTVGVPPAGAVVFRDQEIPAGAVLVVGSLPDAALAPRARELRAHLEVRARDGGRSVARELAFDGGPRTVEIHRVDLAELAGARADVTFSASGPQAEGEVLFVEPTIQAR